MTNPNTTTPTPATLSESELFAEFLTTSFVEYDRMGRRMERHHVSDLLNPDGHHDYVSVDFRVDEDDPAFGLEMIENELETALYNVRLAREAFEAMKSKRLVEPDEDDDDAGEDRYTCKPDGASRALHGTAHDLRGAIDGSLAMFGMKRDANGKYTKDGEAA